MGHKSKQKLATRDIESAEMCGMRDRYSASFVTVSGALGPRLPYSTGPQAERCRREAADPGRREGYTACHWEAVIKVCRQPRCRKRLGGGWRLGGKLRAWGPGGKRSKVALVNVEV